MSRVLIVEDDTSIARLLTSALDLEGYECSMVSTAEDALPLLDSWSPEAILLDLVLPGMDGAAFLLRIREEGSAVPVVLLSAHPAVAAIAEDVHADAFIRKPFDLDELLRTVADIVGRGSTGRDGQAAS